MSKIGSIKLRVSALPALLKHFPKAILRTRVGEKYIQLGRNLKNYLLILGMVILIPIVLIALFAPFITSYDPLRLNLVNKFLSPSWEHFAGTDEFGRDVFSRLIYGSRISIRVGGLTALFTCFLGVIIGSFAGYYKTLDAIVMRVMDGMMAFPGILLAIIIVSGIGPSEFNVVIAMAIIYTPRITRVVRGSVMEAKMEDYVDAARVVGLSNLRILLTHILPNCLAPLIVQATFGFAWAILVEASLSFVGLGTPPPAPSWGNIISDGREFIRNAPWLMISPGLMISATVLGLNLIGDGLRDILDPRLRHARR